MFIEERVIRSDIDKRERLNITLFSLGILTSIFGSSIYTFAMGLHVLNLTGSGLSFATTLVLGLLPGILANPIAGVMADRFNRKVLVVGMDLFSGTLLLGLYIYTSTHGLGLMVIYITTLALTVFNTLFNVSFEVALPDIVTEAKLMSINSISRILNSAASILGPMIGGAVYAMMDIRFFILVNGGTFIFSALIEMFIDFKLNAKVEPYPREISSQGFLRDIKDALEYVLERRWIINLFYIFVFLNFFLSLAILVPLPFIINEVLTMSSHYYGVIQGAFPVGAIVGALMLDRFYKGMDYYNILSKTTGIISLCMGLMGLPLMVSHLGSGFYLIYYSGIMAVLGVAISFIDIPIAYILQTRIEEEYRGRVLSMGISMAKMISPLGLLISGYLVNKVPPFVLPITGALLSSAFNWYWTSRFLKTLDEA